MNLSSTTFPLPLLMSAMFFLMTLPEIQADEGPPNGCGSNIIPLYYKLCDLHAAWGVVVEALAATGVMVSFILLVVLLGSLPFVTDSQRRSTVGLQASFLVCTMGLFCLTFAFIVGQNFSTCTARRFLFGVLFAGAFACLLMQAVRLNVLAHHECGPPAWALGLGALALWLVEVIINTEWLVLTYSPSSLAGNATVTCFTSNQDFAMALIYVMLLLVATLIAAVPPLAGKQRHWQRECAFLLATASITFAIWLVWLTMYLYGNSIIGNLTWDDPTLAFALVLNSWVFLILSSTPQVYMLTNDSMAKPGCGETVYSNVDVGYQNIMKEKVTASTNKQACDNLYMENKTFSMEEPRQASKPVSPYNNYTGPIRGCVYQPTELALITKGLTNKDWSYETSISRTTANPHVLSYSPTAEHSNRTLPSVGPLYTNATGHLPHKPHW